MATTIEKHYHAADGSSSDSTAAWIVGIVAVLAVAGIAFWASQSAYFNSSDRAPDTSIDVNVPDVMAPSTEQGDTVQ
jgi:hypothetical protein